jgi:hypothetical protein
MSSTLDAPVLKGGGDQSRDAAVLSEKRIRALFKLPKM